MGWGGGAEDNIRPRTRQMVRINSRKMKPMYSNAFCQKRNRQSAKVVGGIAILSGLSWSHSVPCLCQWLFVLANTGANALSQ